MKKIIEYAITYHEEVDHLADLVCDLICEGWQPYGSMVAIAVQGNTDTMEQWQYNQPMVRYEE